jgi:hypothetical protein
MKSRYIVTVVDYPINKSFEAPTVGARLFTNRDDAIEYIKRRIDSDINTYGFKMIADGEWPGNGTWVVGKSYIERHYIFHRDAIRTEVPE